LDSRDSENTLVHRSARGDQSAYATLYEMHVERVYRHVRYQVFDAHDAEDITQEVFIKAWKSIHRYKPTGAPFVAWLIVVARNAVTDYFRSKRSTQLLDDTNEPGGGNDPVASVETAFGGDEVRGAILTLQGDKRAVVVMRFIDGFSYEEIGRALGKTEGAVRVIQHRALKELRGLLDEATLR
jgi:RNA polymerase sigma-70 factor (ECF subfamily)